MAVMKNDFVEGCLPEELMRILKALASEWGDVPSDQDALQVVPIKGAMTNEVYQIIWPIKTDGDLVRKVLVRIYGEGVEIFFNRDDEIRTFECISKHGQGPRLLGRFPEGRVEEFIYARTLSAEDLRNPDVSALIAKKMREFHHLNMPGTKAPLLWKRIRNWLHEAKNLCSPKEAKKFRLSTIEEEVNMLEKELSANKQEIGFCHNDLQYGNIMIDEHTRSITFIDYEYASYNPVVYDIANHFCEMAANYHSDTPHILNYDLYPDLTERRRFVQIYLSSEGKEPSDEQVEKLLNEAEKYTLVNHLFWGLWGIISGYVNNIDFDYIEYARQRFKQYWLKKPLLLGSKELADEETNFTPCCINTIFFNVKSDGKSNR